MCLGFGSHYIFVLFFLLRSFLVGERKGSIKGNTGVRRVWWVLVVVLSSIMLVVAGLFTTHMVDRSLLSRSFGAPGAWVDGVFDGWLGYRTVKDDGGLSVSYQDEHSMGVTDTGVLFAPKPVQEFRHATCDTVVSTRAQNHDVVDSLGVSSWVVPGVHDKKLSPVSARVSLSGFDGEPMVLPSAPDGVLYASGAQLGDAEGAVVEAGHVNFDDGRDLSPWGYLHRVGKCEHVFQKDSLGRVFEFVVTDVFTVPQHGLESLGELWRADGEKALYLVTCSGRSVGDDGSSGGNTLLFDYEYNLVVRAVPVGSI